jgi:hypothetical protein
MRRNERNPAERLRFAVEALPRRTRAAMLRGITSNRIVVGAYVDRDSGGICPMLAAHRNGGRTSLSSFARAWDRYTGAKRPRLATRRELRTLRTALQSSLTEDRLANPGSTAEPGSIAEAAGQIRAERAAFAATCPEPVTVAEPADAPIRVRRRGDTGERHRAQELHSRLGWSWVRPARRYEEFRDLLAAAEEQLVEQRALQPGEGRSASHSR